MNPPATIVDAHVHLWDPLQLRYAWLDGVPQLNRPFLPSDLAAVSSGVTKMIFVESGCGPGQSLAEVEWATELAKHEPRLKSIVAQAPVELGEGALPGLEALAKYPLVKGVRRLLQGERDPEFCLEEPFVFGVNLAGKLGWTFDLCIRHEQLRSVTELVRRCPQVNFVLDHLGKPAIRAREFQPWGRDLQALAALPNVACKISGLTTEAEMTRWQLSDLKPYIEHASACFGFDRVMFGSDWPVATLATTYERWLEVVLSASSSVTGAEREKFFSGNAERVYGISA